MNYLDVCTGISAATCAWKPLGFKAAAFSEIEKFPCALLKHHYPLVPNMGDMTKFNDWKIDAIDILVGGTPCQSFSVAGLRKGLDDPRGNLMLTYLAIARKFRPKWVVWENVPGVLSSNSGRDFGAFLGGLAELGYGFAYRVLDAQNFGVPQSRRRVFVVGCLGDCRSAAAVLFERESLQRNPKKSRGEGEEIAKFLTRGSNQRLDSETETFVTYGIPGNWIGRSPENGGNSTEPMNDMAPCLTKTDRHAVAHVNVISTMRAGASNGGSGHGARSGDCKDEYIVPLASGCTVRRLTPRECERLQGFSDGYTDVEFNGKPSSDSVRYKALGNSMAVPCMEWIGNRIKLVNAIAA